jgi:adenine deaminase
MFVVVLLFTEKSKREKKQTERGSMMETNIKSLINRENKDNELLDIIIRNGWIIDGTGNPRYRADIAIKGDKIVEIGKLDLKKAILNIDAAGKIVCR